MINPKDEDTLRSLYQEMNLGFSAPSNGGVPAQSVVVLKNGEGPVEQERKDDDGTDDTMDAQQCVSAVIDDLNHIKMDLDQGCQGDAQIQQLEACCQKLNQVIEQIGNDTSKNHQSGAFTGINSDGNQGDGGAGAEAASAFDNF